MTDKEKLIEINNIVADMFSVARDNDDEQGCYYAGKIDAILELGEEND